MRGDAENVVVDYLEGTGCGVATESEEVVGAYCLAICLSVDVSYWIIAPMPRFVFVSRTVWIVRIRHEETVFVSMLLKPG